MDGLFNQSVNHSSFIIGMTERSPAMLTYLYVSRNARVIIVTHGEKIVLKSSS